MPESLQGMREAIAQQAEQSRDTGRALHAAGKRLRAKTREELSRPGTLAGVMALGVFVGTPKPASGASAAGQSNQTEPSHGAEGGWLDDLNSYLVAFGTTVATRATASFLVEQATNLKSLLEERAAATGERESDSHRSSESAADNLTTSNENPREPATPADKNVHDTRSSVVDAD